MPISICIKRLPPAADLVQICEIIIGDDKLFSKLIIVVPTRNRAEMACRSVQSIVDANQGSAVHVIVSDNSTEQCESSRIDDFVSHLGSENVSIIRPALPLPMTEHWQWAIATALLDGRASHVLLLTDRMLFKNYMLAALLKLVRIYHSALVSFTYDRIDDYLSPITFLPLPRSGKVYRIASKRLLQLSAEMVFFSCLPRMLNSVVPVEVLRSIGEKYGSIFSSISPDFCFCYRALDVVDSIVYYDKSLLVNYGMNRSNGASNSRGIPSKDSLDFASNMDSRLLNQNTPIPSIHTVGNAIIHEYRGVSLQMGFERFPEVQPQKYLNQLANEVSGFVDSGMRTRAYKTLIQNGWRPGLIFYLQRVKEKAIRFLLALRSRKFTILECAIEYAKSAPDKDFSLVVGFRRRYGDDIIPGPGDPNVTESNQ